jgi:hypothetical protein
VRIVYARFHEEPDPGGVTGRPGFAGYYLFDQIGTGRASMLTLWHRREDAEPPTGDLYEVEDDWPGTAAGERPAAAGVVYFDGPLSDARVAAGRRAHADRLRPALRDLPGLVRTISLWHADERKVAVVSLATSLDHLEAGGRAVNSTELLPGEDPALLPGPDRVDIHRVAACATPTAAKETVS